MTDPFFQTGNVQNNPNNTINPNNTPWNPSQGQSFWNTQNQTNPSTSNPKSTPQNTLEQQKQQLLSQQEQIQLKYQQLKDLYQNNQLNVEQKQQVQEQMQKLSDLYTQNKQTLAMLATDISWEKQVQINKNVQVKEQKTQKKISFWGIMIWCGIIFTFLIWWLAAVFYYLIQNPSQLSSIGIAPAAATQLLQVFAIIFFWLLFFASLGMLIVNFYRLTTVKNKSKIPYIFGVILWFIILIATLILWSRTLNILKDIEVGSSLDPNQLLLSRLILKNDAVAIGSDPRLVVIAPANITFELNSNLFNKQIVPRLWNAQNVWVILDCWNWQTLQINWTKFVWACFYQKKWTYPIKLKINYVNSQTSEQLSQDVTVGDMIIRSEVSLKSNKWDIKFWNNEMIVGTNPVNITYDASDIFREFQLSEYKISWDADWDWVSDKSDFTIYTHVYTGAGVYSVAVRFPSLNNYIYIFPIRVEQSDVPVAYLNYTAISNTEYNISAEFYDIGPNISEYVFNIIDKQTNKKIDTINSKNPTIKYTFPWNGVYSVQLVFVTQEWKQGTAESDNIEVGGSQFQIFYDLSIKTPTKPNFQKLDNLEEIQISEIPTILKIDITNIIPSLATARAQVFVDGSPIVSTNNSFQTTIDSSKDYNIKIVVNDPNRDVTTEKEIKVMVKRDDIIWKLLVSPDTVGTSPFSVKFDASTTTITDPQDEIVYFSWDFGDWTLKPNLSQSIINHTYTYDFDKENGVFYPTVTVKTKKGRELLVGQWTMISVKKPTVTLDITLDSHPAQIANVWEKVDMSLNISWLPEKIIWTFGNWNTLECKWRECTSTSQIYNAPWDYSISVSVSYSDKPTIEGKINLVVK